MKALSLLGEAGCRAKETSKLFARVFPCGSGLHIHMHLVVSLAKDSTANALQMLCSVIPVLEVLFSSVFGSNNVSKGDR